jgi:hypothetical protein
MWRWGRIILARPDTTQGEVYKETVALEQSLAQDATWNGQAIEELFRFRLDQCCLRTGRGFNRHCSWLLFWFPLPSREGGQGVRSEPVQAGFVANGPEARIHSPATLSASYRQIVNPDTRTMIEGRVAGRWSAPPRRFCHENQDSAGRRTKVARAPRFAPASASRQPGRGSVATSARLLPTGRAGYSLR